MTDREKAVVMAYTGVVMLAGDKLGAFYDYVEEITGKRLHTYELPRYLKLIAEKSWPDFEKLCAGESCELPAARMARDPQRVYDVQELRAMLEATERRLRHLLKSGFIRSFDEIDPKTGKYKRHIAEADGCTLHHGEWIDSTVCVGFYECSQCRSKKRGNQPFFVEVWNYCPNCGAKMDGGKSNAQV